MTHISRIATGFDFSDALKLWGFKDKTPLPDLIPGGNRRAEKPEASCVLGALPGTDCVTTIIWSQPRGLYGSYFPVGNAEVWGLELAVRDHRAIE